MSVNRHIPVLNKILYRPDVIEMAMGEDNRVWLGAFPEVILRPVLNLSG
jgi:hypothetical protein